MLMYFNCFIIFFLINDDTITRIMFKECSKNQLNIIIIHILKRTDDNISDINNKILNYEHKI